MSNRFIIGAGLSGLIFRLYNPDYQLISENIGGLYRETPFSGVTVLHDTPETRGLLRDLDLPLEKDDIRIAFIRENQVLPITEMTEEERINTCLKKIIPFDKIKDGVKGPHLVSTSFCTGTEYMEILQVNNLELINKLREKVEVRKGKVLEVGSQTFTLGHKENLVPFDEIVSTIPAPTFWKLYGGREVKIPEIKSIPVTVAETIYSPPGLDFSPVKRGNNLTIFAPDLSVPYTRICVLNNKFYYEFTGDFSFDEIRKELETPRFEVTVSKTGRILDNFNNFPPPSIRFLGRFATWKHKDCIEDIISRSISKFNFEAMIARQAAFNANFFDFNNMNLEEKQRETKEFVLDAISELNSILEAINWKRHRRGLQEVNQEKIKEEIIDTLKFILGISNIWGLSAKEIVDEFFRKSAVVEKRYRVEFKEM